MEILAAAGKQRFTQIRGYKTFSAGDQNTHWSLSQMFMALEALKIGIDHLRDERF